MNRDVKAALGERVTQLRKAAGLTQDQLAVAAGGMSRAFVSAIERGEASASIESLERLSRALEVEIADLVKRAPQARANPRRDAMKLSPEERIARTVAALARGADARTLRRFERIAQAFFSK